MTEFVRLAAEFARRLGVEPLPDDRVDQIARDVLDIRGGRTSVVLGLLTEKDVVLLLLAHLHVALGSPRALDPWHDETFIEAMKAAIWPRVEGST